jgi:hypothetical protein
LPDETYEVEVFAEARGIGSPVASFTLRNDGVDYRVLRLL